MIQPPSQWLRNQREDELRALSGEGDLSATNQLAILLANQGRTRELQGLVDAGSATAARLLVQTLRRQGYHDRADSLARFGRDPN